MYLDSIEASLNGVRCRLSKIVHDPWKLVEIERARLRDIEEAVVHKRLGSCPDRRRRNRRRPVLLEVDM